MANDAQRKFLNVLNNLKLLFNCIDDYETKL